MKKIIPCLLLVMTLNFSFGQTKKTLIINDSLIAKYFDKFVYEATKSGYDVQDQLLAKISYILIANDEKEIDCLSEYDVNNKLIVLDSKVRLDRLILKASLYRELCHVLGAPYNTNSVIMDRVREKGFSYVAFDDSDIMIIELNKILTPIKLTLNN